jgi:probable addiction module antidote protein
MKKYRSHDDYLVKALKDPGEAALYLNAAVEENDPALLVTALAQVVKAHGMSRTARRARLTRMGLYKTLSPGGNPELKTFLGIVNASGVRLAFQPLAEAA